VNPHHRHSLEKGQDRQGRIGNSEVRSNVWSAFCYRRRLSTPSPSA